ncbi:F-box/FBD/LRR-repeat protein At1g13570 [Linum grandiflorum]
MKRLCQSDRISSLPADVIHHILMLLDLKDAAKTAILSRRWRHHWTNIPKLEFCYDFGEVIDHGGPASNMNKILLDIYKILLLHEGPIIKFVLSIPGLMLCDEIDPIIRYVSKKGVQHILLIFVEEGVPSEIEISSSLFYAVQLNRLELHGGKFLTPSWFGGFSRLKVMHLETVILSDDFFEKFIPMCSLLEDLRLIYCEIYFEQGLVAPCLKVFVFVGYLHDILMFKYTPLLAVLSIQLTGASCITWKEEGPDMVALFASLPALQQLYVNLNFLEYLVASDHVPHKLPTVLSHLRLLSIHEECCYMKELETKVIFCLLKSSLRLHRLTISMGSGDPVIPKEPLLVELESEEYWQVREDIELNCLKEVHIEDLKGSQWEMLVLWFALKTAQRLQRVVIQPSVTLSRAELLMLVNVVSQWKPTSRQAEVIYR